MTSFAICLPSVCYPIAFLGRKDYSKDNFDKIMLPMANEKHYPALHDIIWITPKQTICDLLNMNVINKISIFLVYYRNYFEIIVQLQRNLIILQRIFPSKRFFLLLSFRNSFAISLLSVSATLLRSTNLWCAQPNTTTFFDVVAP